DLIIGAKVEFPDVYAQVGGIHQDFLQRFERRYYHPVKREGYDSNKEDETGDPEDADNGYFKMLPVHLLISPFKKR
ncbi:MAG: hypothetical protein JRE24_06175, partial [Deltaproteobacteria bacterium]|nr:hypothetical protein [Deltaproteobacteria bacterium]